jgi:uncharacterized paraquat-inducible protein A
MWRAAIALNVALLALFPASWLAPLARAAVWPLFFSANEITMLSGIRDLWTSDAALATLVALFAIVIPYAKTVSLALIHAGRLGPRALPAIEVIGKLSMADVFLVALYIVVVKGVGVGTVSAAWGLWLFTGCVLASIWVAHVTRRRLAASG